MKNTYSKLPPDTKETLIEWREIQKQNQQHLLSQRNAVELVQMLFNHLETSRNQLNGAVQENQALKEQNRRMANQNGDLENQLEICQELVNELRAEVDSLRGELSECKLPFRISNSELQNITVRHSRMGDAVERIGPRKANTKSLLKPRARLCSNTPKMAVPSEKRAKRGLTKDSEDDDNFRTVEFVPTTPRPQFLLPPLVLTPLSSRFPPLPRRSFSVEPTPTHLQKNAEQQLTMSRDGNGDMPCPSSQKRLNDNGEIQCPSSSTSSTFAASTSDGSAVSVFSADGGLLGPVTFIRRRNIGDPQTSWLANRIRNKGLLWPDFFTIFRPVFSHLVGRAFRVPPAVAFPCFMASSSEQYAGGQCHQKAGDGQTPAIDRLEGAKKDPKAVTEDEWRKVLSPEAFEVTRQSGTEAPFTGKFDKHFVAGGKYTCVCCGAALFVSEQKFNSGCGWPAFSKSIGDDQNIVRLPDNSYGRQRIEVRCAKCDAHLGHVFDDGLPADGGQRYCINSVSIDFVSGQQK
ncbi:hypothetical protein niasHS_014541 [Heterodera schachtii]|uniref:Peptide methionine sulfoxide reductase B1, chloroplastic n=1 Tax=Heterodera schachtii TaxID=97005 RepID=A0ABD2IF60_HETSC